MSRGVEWKARFFHPRIFFTRQKPKKGEKPIPPSRALDETFFLRTFFYPQTSENERKIAEWRV